MQGQLNKTPIVLFLMVCFAYFVVHILQLDYNTGYAPQQPIAFSHELHAGKLAMDCLYCHSNAEKGPHATVPPMSTCMGCHSVVATQSPEIKKLTEYYEKNEPVPWVRIHRLPDHVYFTHQVHLNAGVACQTCHGEIQETKVVAQVRELEMGDCVSCHKDDNYITTHFAENKDMAQSKYYYLRYLGEQTKTSAQAVEKLERYAGEYHSATGMAKYQNASLSCDTCHQ